MTNRFQGGVLLGENGSPVSPPADFGLLHALDVGGKTEPQWRDSAGLGGRFFQDSWIVCANNSGATIPAYSVVRPTGASSNLPTIGLADADTLATMPSMGLTMEGIANGAQGRVMLQGVLIGPVTTGMTAGLPIFASGTAGGFTQTAPGYPAYRQVLGQVAFVGATGILVVNTSHYFKQAGDPVPVVLFDGGSTLATSILADVGAWIATTNAAGVLSEVRGRLRTASSSGSVTAVVTLNGTTTIGTLTFAAASLTSNTLTPNQAIAAGDWITVHVTGAGTGAKMLTVVGEIMAGT